MKVLFITRHYLDESNGGANASKGFIFALSKLFENFDLIYPERNGVVFNCIIPANITAHPVYDYRSKIRKGIDIYRGVVHRFCNYVEQYIIDKEYDIIFVDHSLTFCGIGKQLKDVCKKLITIHHNVEAIYLHDNKVSWLYRIPYNFYLKKAERDSILLSDINLTLTDDDGNVFRNWYPSLSKRIFTVGICEHKLIKDKFFGPYKFNNTFIISGSLSFDQSIKPVIEFIEDYLPILTKFFPNCKLIITGRNPNTRIQNLCVNNTNIELIPNPDDINSIIKRGSVYVCPIHMGSGIKLRVLDGVKNGLPVLCHKKASIGYESFVELGHMYTYVDKTSFENAIKNIDFYNISSDSIYHTYKQIFGYEEVIKKISMLISST